MPERFQSVLLVGPPGAGKGTQGRVIGAVPGFFHCACGDVFRRMNPHSEIGEVFIRYSSQGQLVPDDVTVTAWSNYIHAQAALNAYKPEADLLVLDGIPRNVNQAERLEAHCRMLKVIELVCPDPEKLIERIRRRALKEHRFDDAQEPIIRERFEVYRQETAPVLAHYDASIRAQVDAMRSPAEVLRACLDELIPVQNKLFARG